MWVLPSLCACVQHRVCVCVCVCVSTVRPHTHTHFAGCNAALTQRGAVCDQDVCGVGDLVPLVQQSLAPGQVEAPAVVPGLPAGGDRGGKHLQFTSMILFFPSDPWITITDGNAAHWCDFKQDVENIPPPLPQPPQRGNQDFFLNWC